MPKFNPIPPNLTTQQIDYFWSRVDKSPGQGPRGECWQWTGCFIEGYGIIAFRGVQGVSGRKRNLFAHRLALFLKTGEWPPVAMHSCDNPPCCRPEHISAGTIAKNLADAAAKGRMASGDRNATRLYPERMAKGERHGRAKIRNLDAITIRARAAAGETATSIAQDYPVQVTSVRQVIRRETFRHI